MKKVRWKRWCLRIGSALVLVLVMALVLLYAASEHVLRRSWDAPQHALSVPDDAASVAEGSRLARIRGCNSGCHGRDGIVGRVFVDDPWIGRLNAPSVSGIASRYADAQLERAIRHGIKPDGSGVYAMPSEMFGNLDDKDLARSSRSCMPNQKRFQPFSRLGSDPSGE